MPSLPMLIKKIKSLQIQGAKEIAVESLKFLKSYARKHNFNKEFFSACEKLELARPTAVVLHNCLEIIRHEKKIEAIDRVLNQLETAASRIAATGSNLIEKNSVIMTHCHSGEALALIKAAKSKRIKVIVPETDPLEQGVKTAKELAKEKIPVTLITDSAVAHFMPEVDMVIVGADALRKGGFANKIGTTNLALAAYEYGKPFYVVADTFKLDKRKRFEIEERPAKEVYQELLHPGRLKGIKLRNPAFDLVMWKFVTAVITEKGIFNSQKIKKMIK